MQSKKQNLLVIKYYKIFLSHIFSKYIQVQQCYETLKHIVHSVLQLSLR